MFWGLNDSSIMNSHIISSLKQTTFAPRKTSSLIITLCTTSSSAKFPSDVKSMPELFGSTSTFMKLWLILSDTLDSRASSIKRNEFFETFEKLKLDYNSSFSEKHFPKRFERDFIALSCRVWWTHWTSRLENLIRIEWDWKKFFSRKIIFLRNENLSVND